MAQPLVLVNDPQKLSRKNFDKHKISAAFLKVNGIAKTILDVTEI